MDIQALPDDVLNLKSIVLEQQAVIEQLRHQLEKLQRLLFGQKSEKRAKATSLEEADVANKKADESKSSDGEQTKRNGRKKLPEELERIRIEHDVPVDLQVCSTCQSTLHRMGEVTSEQLDFIPAKLYVKQHVRYKYACRCCQSVVITAELAEQPIAKGLAGSGLLAALLIDKYEDALPLYRQEQRWKRLGYEITRSTLCDWVSQCAQRLAPIVAAMKETHLLSSPKIHSDDTVVPVLAEGKTQKGRLWVYRGGTSSTPACVVYQYSPTRKQEVPLTFLANYQGFLQADAYAGYDKCYEKKTIIEVGCWAHARRKFAEVADSISEPSLASWMIEQIGKLYGIERKSKPLADEQRYHYRRKYAKPILRKTIYPWLKKYQRFVLPKSPLGQAIQYCLNHWQALNNYLRAGYLDIDNNLAERLIKPVVIGRKNYLFAGSHQGAQNAAVIYSLIQTCKLLEVNTFEYLRDVLEKLPTTLMKNIAHLFPQNYLSNKK
jgi:transposase